MSAATYPLSPFGRAGGSYLAPDLTVRGRIETSGSVEMDCEFHGDVLARQAYVGPNGRIRARISAEEATVSGEMTGIVTARQAFFRDGCHFRGEVEYESLGTEPNAGVDARLVPVLTGSSSIAIPSVRDIPAQPAALPAASAPALASAPPRINLSMLAFLGGMIVAGVITGILVVNPTTRSWKDQLLEQVLQPRPDAVPPAPMAATPVVSEEPRITPPPPPAIPPSLSKMLPTPAAQDPVPMATEALETRSAAAPASALPAPASTPAAPAAPDMPATPALPRHETVASPSPAPTAAPVVTASPADVPPAPAHAAQTTPTPTAVIEPPAALPVVASPAPVSPAPVSPAPVSPASPPPATQAPAALPAIAPVAPSSPPVQTPSSATPAKAAMSAEPAKPLVAVDAARDTAAKDAKAPTALPASPAQSPVPAAAKKPKSPVLPAGARGALQEVCSWELKCDSDNQCVSVRSCKMQ